MTTHLPTATLPPGYLLRRLRPVDTVTTARLHRGLLPNGLFPRLGPRFLRYWHATFLDTPAATGLAVVHHGEVVAFVLATLDQRLYLHHTLRRHRWSLMWRGALGLLTRPVVLVRFLRTRVRAYARHLLPGRGAGRTGAQPGQPPRDRPERRVRVAVVHAVVTSEAARGQGCARALLDTVADAARRARADHVALVTDVADPASGAPVSGAAAMYERLGWRREGVRRHRDGRWVAEYRLDLDAPAAGS
ncbi:GNAT family N-acetyltransferase [Jannaschia sp. R86511]|uniref:GNAT family N-acetyltransferase n=1 Tax=Jannaschia sp. R86511 TaxID=3093853 RepID=UPI0036D38005